MNEVVVNKTNFDNTIKKMDNLSKENNKLPQLKKFQEKTGPFELFSKHVKGDEMNEFASQVQDNFIALNDRINQCYKQFVEIYNAFDSLDKEYITGIVASFNQAIEATRKADLAQQDINKTVKILETAVTKMKEFNSKVNSELSRIDGVNWKENALKHQNELDEIDKKANEIIITINNYKSQHNELISQLDNYKKEKLETQKMLKFCWISTTCLFVVVLLFIILIVFNVI